MEKHVNKNENNDKKNLENMRHNQFLRVKK